MPKRDREAFELRLLVQVPAGTRQPKSWLRAGVDSSLGDDADGRAWKVDPLFPTGSRRKSARLMRHFAVTGRVTASPSHPPQALAFDVAHLLSAQTGAVAQPDLPSSSFARPVEVERGPTTACREPETPKRWALDAMGCGEAWKLEPTRGAGIAVGHPDTGFTDHHELEADALDLDLAWDVLADDRDARDPLARHRWWNLNSPGHGTGTASAIVGRESGSICGTAPGATLVPFRTVKSVVQVFDGDVARAVDRARKSGCHIISMSLGGVGFADALRDAIGEAVESGMIVMAAAGNYVGFVTAPACYPECLALGATGIGDRPWKYSSHGPQVDLCAPGEGVWAAGVCFDDDVARFVVNTHNGTSFAVAHTAGVAALWLAHHGAARLRREFAEKLQHVFLSLARATARRVVDGWDGNQYGAGILDARALLEAELPDRKTLNAELGGRAKPARGMALAATAERASSLEKLSALWPGLRTAEVRSKLGNALAKRGTALDEAIEVLGGELFYAFSQDPVLHERFGRTGGMAAMTAGDGGPAIRDDLKRVGSRTLNQMVGS